MAGPEASLEEPAQARAGDQPLPLRCCGVGGGMERAGLYAHALRRSLVTTGRCSHLQYSIGLEDGGESWTCRVAMSRGWDEESPSPPLLRRRYNADHKRGADFGLTIPATGEVPKGGRDANRF